MQDFSIGSDSVSDPLIKICNWEEDLSLGQRSIPKMGLSLSPCNVNMF